MSDQEGHLVPPAWLEAHGFTPETWQRYVLATFDEEPRSARLALVMPMRQGARLWRKTWEAARRAVGQDRR